MNDRLPVFDDLTEYRSTSDAVELFPFTVRVARNRAQLQRVAALKSSAYGRHKLIIKNSNSFIAELSAPDTYLTFVAEDKATGAPVGSVRVQNKAMHPYLFLKELKVPFHLSRVQSVCVSRLCVIRGPIGSLARNALCKAVYLYAVSMQCRYKFAFVDEARRRLYSTMGFVPVFKDDPELCLPSNDNIPFKLQVFDVASAESAWKGMGHPLYNFVLNTFHPDIEIFSSVASFSDTRRISDSIPDVTGVTLLPII